MTRLGAPAYLHPLPGFRPRVRTLPLALIAAALLVLPGATAAVPLPGEGSEIVSGHSRSLYASGHSCTTTDPATGLLSTDLTSRLQHVAEAGGMRVTLQLDAIPGDDACPAVDVSFFVAASWPTMPQEYAYGDFTTDCGAVGSFLVMRWDQGYSGHAFWSEVPSGCALGIPSSSAVQFSIQLATPSPAMACTPVLLPTCVGAQESTWQMPTSCSSERLAIHGGLELVYGMHGCDHRDGEEFAQAGDSFGIVRVRATQDSCMVFVGDFLGGPAQQNVGCPQPAGDALYGTDWHTILP